MFENRTERKSGAYTMTIPTAGKSESRFLYLGEDLVFSLRWTWCDEVEDLPSRIDHRGWFSDDMQLQTIRGIVFRLNKNRGFLAGWSMGEGMASEIETAHIFEDEIKAAYAADSIAELIAEKCRTDDERQFLNNEIEELKEENIDTISAFSKLKKEARLNHGGIICALVKKELKRLRFAVSENVRSIKSNRDKLIYL